MSFQKIPVVFEAVQTQVPTAPADDVSAFLAGAAPDWLQKAIDDRKVRLIPPQDETDPGALVIDTLDGAMTCHGGDWIIQGATGALHPCTPDVFAASYEAVSL